MAATLTQERFIAPEWIFERKFDGIRVLAYKQGGDVRLLSRNRLAQNIPPVAAAIASLPVSDAIFDGEVTWSHSTRAEESARSGQGTTVTYHVFDVLWLDGRNVTPLPLEDRRALLSGLPLQSPLERVAVVDHDMPWQLAREKGWEGVIAKRKGTPYEHKRSRHWLKMKCEATQDLVVGGFTDPQGKRVGLGALLVGYFAPRQSSVGAERESKGGGDFVFAGKVGTGFDTKLLLDLRARLDALEIAERPFTKAVGLPRLRAHWVRTDIVVRVAFIEWTTHGKLRHPRLIGIRTDKAAREVVRETP